MHDHEIFWEKSAWTLFASHAVIQEPIITRFAFGFRQLHNVDHTASKCELV